MRGSVGVFDMTVVFRLLIGILNDKPNWSSRGHPLEYTRKELDLIWFFALGNYGGLSRFSADHFCLNGIEIYL